MSEYVSTRDPNEEVFSYGDVLLQGLAPDGGLYVPVEIPQLRRSDLLGLAGDDYADIFVDVKGRFLGDEIEPWVQYELADGAFSQDKFPVEDRNLVPVTEIDDGFHIQQLSLGPTGAFKDMALQPLGQDMQHFLAERGESLVLLGATSGDTGSAAEAAIKGLGNLTIFMLSPETGMSDVQKSQMGALSGDNVHNISIPGRFDDCQDLVKAIKRSEEFAQLGAVNSINWGRIASQIPYYVSGYLQAVDGAVSREVDFVVPTGNFGNILAGYIAREMGVPIGRLIVATNENSVVHELVQTGGYNKPPEAKVTTSPSMDITVASNYERVVYDLFGDPEKVRDYMTVFEATGRVDFADFGLPSTILRDMNFDSGVSTASDRLKSIRWAWEHGATIDPHTADAVTVARRMQRKGVPIVCMSTALPFKFEKTMLEALGVVPPRPERFRGIEETLGGFVLVANDQAGVEDYIRTTLAA